MSADPLLRIIVEDVFSIAKRGTVVTGRVEAGTLKVGDEVVIRGRGNEKRTVVTGIESFRKVVGQANAGDTVGILLKDVSRQEVQHGDEILSPGSDFTLNP